MSSLITLKDRLVIESAIKSLDLSLSEYSFTNLYLFRDVHQYELHQNFIKGLTRNKIPFWMPLSFPFELEQGKTYFPISEEYLKFFDESQVHFVEKAADEDYLYCREKMATMPGRKLASQRNFIYRFEEEYNPEVKEFNKDDAKKVLHSWSENQTSETDKDSCLEAIELFEELGLEGMMVYGGDEPLGFIIGERYQKGNMLCHFAKSKPGVKGVTPYLYQNFAKRMPEEVKCMNLEQDLGLETLAKSKASFQPEHKLKKYYLTKKSK